MKKVIFVTTTKPFNEFFKFRQINAITSWLELSDIESKVIILTEDNIIDLFDEIYHSRIEVVSDYEKSDNSGIPVYRSLWSEAVKRIENEKNEFICQINADIILTSSFSKTINFIFENHGDKQFGMLGQRTDWRNPKPLDFKNPEWENQLLDYISNDSELHPTCGIDFIFGNKYTLKELPNFYIARFSYDRWLASEVIKNNEFSINISNTAIIVHQDHNYGDNNELSYKEFVTKYESEISTNRNFQGGNIDSCKYKTVYENGEIVIK